MDKDRIVRGSGIDLIVETVVSTTIEEEEITIITIEITDPTIEVEIGQEMTMEIGEMMAKIIEETTIDRIVTKGIEMGVQVKIVVDPGQDKGMIHGIAQIQEIDMVMIETKSETETDPTLMTGKIVEQGLDQAHM